MPQSGEQVWIELWVSMASLLRSYTAAHGLNTNRQATVELGEARIMVRHSNRWLELDRQGAIIYWRRNDGRAGVLEFTEAGRLKNLDPGFQKRDPAAGFGQALENPTGEHEEEMDMAAEAWARELMHGE